jgi:hypothetical protein
MCWTESDERVWQEYCEMVIGEFEHPIPNEEE